MAKAPNLAILRRACIDILHAHSSGHLSTLADDCRDVAQALLDRIENDVPKPGPKPKAEPAKKKVAKKRTKK